MCVPSKECNESIRDSEGNVRSGKALMIKFGGNDTLG